VKFEISEGIKSQVFECLSAARNLWRVAGSGAWQDDGRTPRAAQGNAPLQLLHKSTIRHAPWGHWAFPFPLGRETQSARSESTFSKPFDTINDVLLAQRK